MELSHTDLLKWSALDLQALLQRGRITSVQLVTHALQLIKIDETTSLRLNAFISVAPKDRLLELARKLDRERQSGRVRSEFHGIPILVKDAFMTDESLGMPTSVGNFALLQARTQRNAPVVQRLLDKGMIVIGKTNMNEFCNWKLVGYRDPKVWGKTDHDANEFRGRSTTNGWSPVGGQTISAYVASGLRLDEGSMGHSNPCGSSTGSAVGVSAGYAPLGLGTETEGSLVSPAGRAALYSLKPTPGSTMTEGVWMLSSFTDSIGWMTKSVVDLAIASELLLTPEARSQLPADGFKSFLLRSFRGMSIGFLDPKQWYWHPSAQSPVESITRQQHQAYRDILAVMQNHGASVKGPVTIPNNSALCINGESAVDTVLARDYAANVNHFLSLYRSSPVRSLEDIIQYNQRHKDVELPARYPDQDRLIQAVRDRPSSRAYEQAKEHARRVAGTRGIGLVMDEDRLDVIVSLLDCPLPGIATAAGYPIGTVPLGIADHNGRPFGLAVVAKAAREDLIFRFMSAFEAVAKPRGLPTALIEARARVGMRL